MVKAPPKKKASGRAIPFFNKEKLRKVKKRKRERERERERERGEREREKMDD